MLVVNSRLEVPLTELDFTFSRSSGPGGQHVNKVNTKVTLHWDVAATPSLPDPIRRRFQERYSGRVNRHGQVVVTSQRFRDQGRNVADCLDKLRQMILSVVRAPTPRRATRPTRASRERRLRAKRAQSEKKSARRAPSRED